MPRVSVGVPVYNGSSMIREALECLAGQDYGDFEVIISDNASTDGTSEICTEFAAADPRFRHVRHEVNRGGTWNFQWVRNAASGELFLWRAHDDLSSSDYIRRLVACFDREPGIRLAAGSVESRSLFPGRAPRVSRLRYECGADISTVRGLHQALFHSHASWFYGLWHRETLAETFDRIWTAYPHGWASDHLTLLPLLLDGAVRGDPGAVFIQRLEFDKDWKTRVSAAEMSGLRRKFDALARAEIAARDWTLTQRLALVTMIPRYVDHRVYPRKRILKRRIREALAGWA